MKNVSIIGLGLIGSSIARGLKGKYRIKAYNRDPKVTKQALKDGVIDEAALQIHEVTEDADIVIVAVPLGSYETVMNEIADYLDPGTILTDVGSVKMQATISLYKHLPPGVHLVPAHPIAGKAESGYEAGDANLFRDKKVVITPLPKGQYEAVLDIENMWKELNARTELMPPKEHDKIYAAVSHVPQLLAYAYKMAVYHKKYGAEQSESGDFKTFMRISHSSPKIWADIFQQNRIFIMKFMDKVGNGLVNIEKFTNQVDLKERLGGEQKPVVLTGDKKEDAAKIIFPALLSNLLLFCIEDEFENVINSPDDIGVSIPGKKRDVKNKNFADYAGTGLRDFSEFSLRDVAEHLETHSDYINILKSLLHRKIFEITAAIESEEVEQIIEKLSEALAVS